jgi:predicted amidohydrolase YtcJ
MLIRDAELEGGKRADVRFDRERILAIGGLTAAPDEEVIDAGGALLLPGLHDHHIHLAALAAVRHSVRCGPPEVATEAQLAAALRIPGNGWLRGTGYHESVAGMLDRRMLDALVPDRPLRIQHRGGRMWFLNSVALDRLLDGRAAPEGLDHATGRLFEGDRWLRETLGATPPDFAEIGAELAGYGITGLTDMSPANDPTIAAHFAAQQAAGKLRQRARLAGNLTLPEAAFDERLNLGPAKLHLHEVALPPLEEAGAFIATAHAQDRPIAIHCVSEVELLYALVAIAEVDSIRGDRIEHASICPDHCLAEIARLGLHVCVQPHFVAERGEAYLRDVEPEARPYLYRLRGFLDAGVPLAGGSDAPFGRPDPWASMAAAVSRRTATGATITPGEALTAEQALDLYLRDPADLARGRHVAVGEPADLCLLDRSWTAARADLTSVAVRATIIGGIIVYDRIDQPPV